MNITQTSLKNQTAVYDATIPASDIATRYSTALAVIAKQTDVTGFRKGKAPVELVEKTVGKEAIYDKLIQTLLPDVYKAILEKDSLRPLVSPKVDLKSAKEGEDWVLTMTIALAPKVKIPDYTKIVAKVRGATKAADIWVPGKEEQETQDDIAKKEAFLNAVLKEIIDSTDLEISDLIIEEEVNHRLSRLVDDIRRLGLTIETYLESRQSSKEQLQDDFKKDIMTTYKLEYALNEIGEKENITIEQAEVQSMIDNLPDEASRKEAQANMNVYGMMLRKQKILEFLGSL